LGVAITVLRLSVNIWNLRMTDVASAGRVKSWERIWAPSPSSGWSVTA
jgi:hypothetical protein